MSQPLQIPINLAACLECVSHVKICPSNQEVPLSPYEALAQDSRGIPASILRAAPGQNLLASSKFRAALALRHTGKLFAQDRAMRVDLAGSLKKQKNSSGDACTLQRFISKRGDINMWSEGIEWGSERGRKRRNKFEMSIHTENLIVQSNAPRGTRYQPCA